MFACKSCFGNMTQGDEEYRCVVLSNIPMCLGRKRLKMQDIMEGKMTLGRKWEK